ncbi:MAG: RHS repeat protein, partial [Chloroflexota bacterium]|nr:RHS repeat protein [Chloroflexota bacterium]
MSRHATTAAGGGAVSSANFNFDEPGRQKFVEYSIPALSATARSFTWNYDSADRVTSMIDPSTETVAYTCDAAWRQTSVCGQGQTIAGLPRTDCTSLVT